MFVYVFISCVMGVGLAGASVISNMAGVASELYNCADFQFQNKCIDDLGCFYTGPPFYDSVRRPLSCVPMNDPKTVFMLYTRSNRKKSQEIEATMKSLEKSYFHPELPVIVLIHGFWTTLVKEDIRFQIKDALLKVAPYNIIVVDWTKHNQYLYEQAAANTRTVGAALANLLKFILDYTNIRAQDIYLIGHSLGAHIAGYVGERISNLGRITGLDPAGPYFYGTDPIVRLDPSDALFVDIIHTNAGSNIIEGLGNPEASGHIDFYPNGGCAQPGCQRELTFPFGKLGKWSINGPLNICDHSRASELFLESIGDYSCQFLGTLCGSYEDYKSGNCTSVKSVRRAMGFRAKQDPRIRTGSKFYLLTNRESSFCI